MKFEWSELPSLAGRVSLVDGCFDPLHGGHLRYFEAAAALGLPVLCNLASDDYLNSKHPPLLRQADRAALVDSLRSIAYVHMNSHTTAEVLAHLRPKHYVKGKDWEGRLPAAELATCAEHGIEIVFADTVLDSSTRLLADQASAGQAQRGNAILAFENLVFSQQSFPAPFYNEDYFLEQWREAGNQYTVAQRRPIEGRNPELIRDVFQPKKAIDFGCGPGVLMFLLAELGIEADGLDFSPGCKRVAPPEVRDRICIGSVVNPPLPSNAYDLVICREVLEHLSIQEVRQAIYQMARITSRYIYLTTRFHPPTDNLLAVTTQFEVDPSHITLMTKELVRVLFILEGCRSRPDLELQLDWLHKGRVMVFEKQVGK